MNKNVLMVLPSDLIGGAESIMMKLSRVLVAEGSRVDIVFLSSRYPNRRSPWTEIDGINLFYTNGTREISGAVFYLLHTLKSMLYFNRKSYDLCFTTHVHCNAYTSLLISLGIIKIKRQVMRESTNVFSWFTGYKLLLIKLLYRLYRKDALLICQTGKMLAELLEGAPFLSRINNAVLRNPIELKANLVAAESNEFSVDVFEFINGKKVLVSVGRLVSEKAFDILLSSFSEIEDVVLLIVGGGPLESELKALAIDLGVSHKVLFLGEQKNPFQYMKLADVGIVSSRLEGFPNVLHEMMCICSIVVSTKCADGVDLIPGIFTCEIEDVASLKSSIIEALSQSEASQKAIKQAMLKYVTQHSSENYLKMIDKHLSKVY